MHLPFLAVPRRGDTDLSIRRVAILESMTSSETRLCATAESMLCSQTSEPCFIRNRCRLLRNAWLACFPNLLLTYFPDRLMLLWRNRLNELIQIHVQDAESTANLDRWKLSRMAPNPNCVLGDARDGGHFSERIVLAGAYVHLISSHRSM
jgi:hypothetical protein